MGDRNAADEAGAYASPPCYLHELDATCLGPASPPASHGHIVGARQSIPADGERIKGGQTPGDGSERRSRLLPERAFPPYAYLSGRFPHPVRDPAGHSYNHETAAPPDPDGFRWGLDLFDHGYYWEAHEAWEPLWRASEEQGSRRHILKGLIVLAAAGVKLRQRKHGAAARHGRRAVTYFRQAAAALDCYREPTLGLAPAVLAAQGELAATDSSRTAVSQSDPEIVFPFTLDGPAPVTV